MKKSIITLLKEFAAPLTKTDQGVVNISSQDAKASTSKATASAPTSGSGSGEGIKIAYLPTRKK